MKIAAAAFQYPDILPHVNHDNAERDCVSEEYGNMGRMNDPDGAAFIHGICGDTMEMYLTIDDNRVTDAKFHTDGCGSSRYCGSTAASWSVGKPLSEVLHISPGQIIDSWRDMLDDGLHCAILAVSTLHKAVADFLLTVQAHGGAMPLRGIDAACHACVLDQVRTAARFAELTDEEANVVVADAQKGIDESGATGNTVQHLVRRAADRILALRPDTPEGDIYASVKKISNERALAYVDDLRHLIDKSDSAFETALLVAGAGNIIDFGAKSHGNIDIDKEIRNFNSIRFAKSEAKALEGSLAGAGHLLYIVDNSGEIIFDTLFLDVLKRLYPALRVTVAFREQPIINDMTLADGRALGLTERYDCISSGSVYPGTIIGETSESFREVFFGADCIIAKGQGNFETLQGVADERLFFLLRIKCGHIAKIAGVDVGGLVLMRG